jgi:hypothetical protein
MYISNAACIIVKADSEVRRGIQYASIVVRRTITLLDMRSKDELLSGAPCELLGLEEPTVSL